MEFFPRALRHEQEHSFSVYLPIEQKKKCELEKVFRLRAMIIQEPRDLWPHNGELLFVPTRQRSGTL